MILIVIYILYCLFFPQGAIAGECSISGSSQSVVYRLQTDLFCDYSSLIRPVINHNNVTNVKVKMILQGISIDHYSEEMHVDNWMIMTWTDEFLKWDPTEYSGLLNIFVQSSKIWIPDLSLYNMGSGGSPTITPTSECYLNYKGTVDCVIPNRQSAVCIPNMTKWPFDTQECTFHFGSWAHAGEEIMFNLAPKALVTDKLARNYEWALIKSWASVQVSTYSCCPNSTFPTVQYTFRVQHVDAIGSVMTITPAVVMMLLTIVAACMNPIVSPRIYILGMNLILHIMFLEHLSYVFMENGNTIPYIILFYRNSMLITTTVLLMTIATRSLCTAASKSPSWLSTFTSILISNKAGQLILLTNLDPMGAAKVTATGGESEDASDLVSGTDVKNGLHSQEWLLFGQLLDRICFLTVLFVYIGMAFTLLCF